MQQPKKTSPPKAILTFFRWFCRPNYLEDIEGDLNEVFEKRIVQFGIHKAKWFYALDVLRLFRPGIIRFFEIDHKIQNYIHMSMLKNYVKVVWRETTKNKIFALINTLGLTLGIVGCLITYLVVSYDFSFDRFHPDSERIYRIIGKKTVASNFPTAITFAPPSATAIREEVSGIEVVIGNYRYNASVSFVPDDKLVKKFEPGMDKGTMIIAGADYFQLFPYEWLAGSASTLNNPNRVVLLESTAHKYFGLLPFDKIIGQEIIYDDSLRMTVSGVIKDWSGNSDHRFTDFLSLSTINTTKLKNQIHMDDWLTSPTGVSIYLKLAVGTSLEKVNSQLASVTNHHIANASSLGWQMQLEPLSNIHFTNDPNRGTGILHWDYDDFRKAYMPVLYVLTCSAIFILIIASINFINLSIAKSSRRTREIGVRKVMGGTRKDLTFQFLVESFFFTLIGVIISLLLVNPILHQINTYIPEGVVFNPFNPSIMVFLAMLTLITALLAGFYPAMVLSSFKPATTLKGSTLLREHGKLNFRKSLIVFQFAISLIFIVGAFVIKNQISFVTKNAGFPVKGIVTIWVREHEKIEILTNKIKNVAGVDKVTVQAFPPLGRARRISLIKFSGIETPVSIKSGDEDYLSVYRIRLLAGRTCSQIDTVNEFTINETYRKQLGFDNNEDVLGRKVNLMDKTYNIVGVVSDFHEGSFHEVIMPIAFANLPDKSQLGIRLDSGKIADEANLILAQVERKFKEVYPDQQFVYGFLEDEINWFYEKEQKTSRLLNAIMIITILISCMGVFGLTMYTAEQKTKEIGIRKVLGASLKDIASLLTKELVWMSGIAILIGAPTAWYLTNLWLQDFAYHIELHWWMFLASGLLLLLIQLITASIQVIKTANINPVISLRSE